MINKVKASLSEKILFFFLIILFLITFGSYFLLKDKCLFVKNIDPNKIPSVAGFTKDEVGYTYAKEKDLWVPNNGSQPIPGKQGALIYNNSKSNAAIAVLDFGSDFSSSNGTFQIQFPTAAHNTALIRIS